MKNILFLVSFLYFFTDAASQSKVPVFVSGGERHKGHRIPAIISIPKGNLPASADGRAQAGADFGNINNLTRRSDDNGKTLGEMNKVPDYDAFQAGNPAFSCQTSSTMSPDQTAVQNDSNKGKDVVLKLEPGADNPRNSEGDFIELKDGRILFIYTHFTGNAGGDHSPAFLAGRYSADGGLTWSQDHQVVGREGDMNVMSVSLLRLQNGNIALFYGRKNSLTDAKPFMRISEDEAKTWSVPIPVITDKNGYFVLNNDRVIQVDDGRIVMAVSLHPALPTGKIDLFGRLWSYFSDDNGRTWHSGKEVPQPHPDSVMLQEPGVIELKDGRIMMFIRTDAGVQYLSYSANRGESWSPVKASNIPSPVSPASIKRIPSTGDLLLVWNNNSDVMLMGGMGGKEEAAKGKKLPPWSRRTPFNCAVSTDEGRTWRNIRTIENDPDGWYCYTAIHFTGNHVLLGHCAGKRSKGTGLSVIHITRLDLDWIYGKYE